VSEGWVGFLGDDDGLMPGALKRLSSLINETNVSAIVSRPCKYSWPSSMVSLPKTLVVNTRKGWEVRSTKPWLESVLCGRASYYDLPMLYHGGFAEINVIREIQAKYGSFFLSRSPDISSAIALSSMLSEYVYSYDSFAIAGESGHSLGASFVHSGWANKSAQEFQVEDNFPLHPMFNGRVPRAIQLHVFDAYLRYYRLSDSELCAEIERQMAIALALSQASQYSEMESMLYSLAGQFSLDVSAVMGRANKNKIVLRNLLRLKRLLEFVDEAYLANDASLLSNVYDASISAQAIIEFVRLGGAFKRQKFLRLLGKSI
jgi:hypothetical protein